MKLELISELSRLSETQVSFFFDGINVLINAVYLEADIPKSQLTTTLSQTELLTFFGALEAVLNRNSEKELINFTKSDILIALVENTKQSTDDKQIIDLRLEKLSKSKFIQISGSATKFYQLRFFLSCVLARLF